MKKLVWLAGLAVACTSEPTGPAPGNYRLTLRVNDSLEIPVGLEIPADTSQAWTVLNGKERISLDRPVFTGDTLRFAMPVFPNEFILTRSNGSVWAGRWYNYDRSDDYFMETRLEPSEDHLPAGDADPAYWLRNWKFTFDPGGDRENLGRGEFTVENGRLYGSILKPSGDLRYLSGYANGNRFALFTFEGTHAYTLTGQITGDSLVGTYTSGHHFRQPFAAIADSSFHLPEGDTLVRLRDGEDRLKFRLPDADGGKVSLSDERFSNRAVIVQIMGSWCPNCMDESRLFRDLYQEFHPQGLEVVAVTFERSAEPERAWKAINRMRRDLELPYHILFGGRVGDEAFEVAFPELTGPKYYPTSVFIDRQGQVRFIHAGFAGPGTSGYEELKQKIREQVLLILEK